MHLAIPLLAATVAGASPEAPEASALEPPVLLSRITVEAAKVPATVQDIAATITVIDEEQIDRELAQDIDDLVRYEPGIDVVDQGSRFGRAGFNIRGIGGNRVRIEIDGVGISDAFAIGDFSNASRDFVDVDSLKQVEIIRGPSSALFGSNAVGGVVSFVTKDPADYLRGESRYFDVRGGYNSDDESIVGGFTAAGQAGDLGASITATYRDGSERNDTGADPFDYQSLNVLGKLAWGEPGLGATVLTLERFGEDSETDVQSLVGVQDFTPSFGFPYVITRDAVTADDERERTRVSVGQDWVGGVWKTDYARWRVYYQDSRTEQNTVERRSTLIMDDLTRVERTRLFDFQQDLWGFEVNLANEFTTGGLDHQLAYGIEYEMADTSQLRDGMEVDLDTGAISNVLGPDDYPVRDFPDSETESLGIYLQDSIAIGAVTLVPGLRWDRYQLDPKPDAIFTDDNPGVEPVAIDDDRLSPKFGILWDLDDRWQLYGQYAEGFRAPPVNDVNVGFTNFQFGYTTIPNPDLESETSQGVEAGVRFFGATAEFDASIFHTRYDDFIASFQVVDFDPVTGLIVFQSVNLEEVEIEGAEFSGRWAPRMFPDGWSLRAAASYARGDNLENDQPLNQVAPFNGVVGLEYESADSRWTGSFLARGAERQDRLDETSGPVLSPSGYVVFDLLASWRPTENTRVRAGLFNIFDLDYTAYLDVAGLPADTPDPERFRRPDRNVSIAFDWTF